MPIQTAQYKIRHLRRHEIEQLLQLCKAEGRHMGTSSEVETWMKIDPKGFFVAVKQEGKHSLDQLHANLSPSGARLRNRRPVVVVPSVGSRNYCIAECVPLLWAPCTGGQVQADCGQLYRKRQCFTAVRPGDSQGASLAFS